MNIRDITQDGATVLILEGRLEAVSALEFEQRLKAVIEGGARRLCVDCADLSFVNSMGLRGFLFAGQRLRALGGNFVIADLQPDVRKVFELVGFAKILNIVANRAEALQKLAAPAAV